MKHPGGTYSRKHRGVTPPGTSTVSDTINRTQEAVTKAQMAIQMKPGRHPTAHLSKGARRAIRMAKGVLRKHGMKV